MWKRLMSVLLVVLLCCPIFAVRAEEITVDGRVNRALLVGCDRFLTQTDTTPSSRNNVLRMADALSGGTLNMQTIVTREDGLPSSAALVALIRETFADADADDVSYFYISTHGLWNTAVNGLMTLLLSDGESEEGITAYELRRVFDTIPGKKVLLLDACHSGAMIGKGVEKSFENLFAGDNYYVVCSSGGEEESWYWSGEVGGERLAGAGYHPDRTSPPPAAKPRRIHRPHLSGGQRFCPLLLRPVCRQQPSARDKHRGHHLQRRYALR